jgi:hypothetical protein
VSTTYIDPVDVQPGTIGGVVIQLVGGEAVAGVSKMAWAAAGTWATTTAAAGCVATAHASAGAFPISRGRGGTRRTGGALGGVS